MGLNIIVRTFHLDQLRWSLKSLGNLVNPYGMDLYLLVHNDNPKVTVDEDLITHYVGNRYKFGSVNIINQEVNQSMFGSFKYSLQSLPEDRHEYPTIFLDDDDIIVDNILSKLKMLGKITICRSMDVSDESELVSYLKFGITPNQRTQTQWSISGNILDTKWFIEMYSDLDKYPEIVTSEFPGMRLFGSDDDLVTELMKARFSEEEDFPTIGFSHELTLIVNTTRELVGKYDVDNDARYSGDLKIRDEVMSKIARCGDNMRLKLKEIHDSKNI